MLYLRYLHPKIDSFYLKIKKFYDSIQLNLGIKRFIEKCLPKPRYRWLYAFDTKIIYPVYKFLDEYFINRIIYHYGASYRWKDEKSQNLDKSRFNLGYGDIHYAIIRNQKPKHVLCIGSMYGFIPFMMAKACMENGKGHVDFVDAGYDIRDDKDKKRHYYGQGFWKKNNPSNHFNYLLTTKCITTHVMTSRQFASKYKRKYDYIYLDGDHSYKGVWHDIKLYWPRLRVGGYLCLHDIHFKRVEEGLPFEHWKAWKKLIKKAPNKMEISNNYSGLGFIQKTGKENI